MGRSASRKTGKSTTSKPDSARVLPPASPSLTRWTTSDIFSTTQSLASYGKNSINSNGGADLPDISSLNSLEWRVATAQLEMLARELLTGTFTGRAAHHGPNTSYQNVRNDVYRLAMAMKEAGDGPFGLDYNRYLPDRLCAAFMWGPYGEWTGLPVGDRRRRSPAFIDYAEWADEIGRRSLAIPLRWGSLLKRAKVSFRAKPMRHWMKAMETSRLSTGGLHPDDESFDPLGVLAHLMGAEWLWDEQEQAYSTNDCVYDLPLTWIADYFEVSPSPELQEFADQLTHYASGCRNFGQVVGVLEEAEHTYEGIANITREALDQSGLRRSSGSTRS